MKHDIANLKLRAEYNDKKAIAILADIRRKKTEAWNRHCEFHWLMVGVSDFLFRVIPPIIGTIIFWGSMYVMTRIH